MNQRRYSFRDLLAIGFGTGLGLGFIPFAPGTFGSLLGPPLVWGLRQFGGTDAVYWSAAAAVFALGVMAATRLERIMGRHDPGSVVIDEIAAFPVVFAVVPLSPKSALLGFVWFRVFDIVKPWPVRRFEKLPRGLGVMADDIVAGIYAAATLWATMLWLG